MSSSNEVAVYIIEEAEYNVTPPAGDFLSLRIASESLDGAANAQQSPEIRPDRQSGGMKVLSTAVSGAVNGLFLRDQANDLLIKCGMYTDPVAAVAMSADTIAVDTTAKTLTFTTGDPSATFSAGDICQLSGFVDEDNNTVVVVVSVTASAITYGGGDLMIDTSGGGAEVATMPGYHDLGKVRHSVSAEKQYTDLDDAFVDYTGERVDTLDFNINYAAYSLLNFSFAGSGHVPMPDAGSEITFGRTITPASTNQTLNSAEDLETILVDGETIACGFSSLQVMLSNNHTPQTKLGQLTACDQIPGQATVTVNVTAELGNTNKAWLKTKLEMTPISIYASQADETGLGYAVVVPAAQVTAPDPAAGGQNQQTSLALSGEGKIADDGGSALRVYLLGTLA